MVKLVCALIGVRGKPFTVEVNEDEVVHHVKEAIVEKQKYEFAASKLQLFLGRKSNGTWLDSSTYDDVTKLMKGKKTALIEALIQEDNELQGVSGLQKVLKDLPPPLMNQIHLLVVVPKVAARDFTRATFSFTPEQIGMILKQVLEERGRRRPVYSLSTCPLSKEMSFKRHLGLVHSSIPVKEVIDDSISGYPWSTLPEKHPDQRKAYITYLEEHLYDDLILEQKQTNFLKDTAGIPDLLDCNDRNRLPFKLTGTADLMIIDDAANQMNDVFAGLQFVIEVKKDHTSYDEQWQLLLELVVADFMCEERRSPVGLLTNLNDFWYFMWFAPNKKIERIVLTCPANAFKTMKQILKEKSGPMPDRQFPMQIACLESPTPWKRQKLLRPATGRQRDEALEALERYELMADELSPEFLRERRLEYALNLVRQMPLYSSMYDD